MSDIRTSTQPGYSPYHPKWYRPRMSTYWWLWRGAYLKFILREMSSAFIAYFVAITLWQIWALGHGPAAYARWEAWMRTPFALVLNGITLFFVVYHAVTWFNLAPKASLGAAVAAVEDTSRRLGLPASIQRSFQGDRVRIVSYNVADAETRATLRTNLDERQIELQALLAEYDGHQADDAAWTAFNDGLVVQALEQWASGEAARILVGIFLVAAGVMAVAALLVTGCTAGPSERSDPEPSADSEVQSEQASPARRS